MGRVIGAVAFVLVVGIVALVVVYLRRRQSKDDAMKYGWAQKGDLNSVEERRLINDVVTATDIFHSLLRPPHVLGDDMTILSDDHRKKIEEWIKKGSK